MATNPSRRALDRCKAPRLELIRTGPLAKHLEGFTSHLLREGYRDGSFYKKSLLVRALNRWLIQHNLALKKIDEARLQQFLADRQGSPRRGLSPSRGSHRQATAPISAEYGFDPRACADY